MRVLKGLSLAIIFLLYASFACAQEPSYAITVFNFPGAVSSYASLVSENDILGTYSNANGNTYGFLYNISKQTYTMINVPGAVSTSPSSLSENDIFGTYSDANGNMHGFIYSISKGTYTIINVPGAVSTSPASYPFTFSPPLMPSLQNGIWGTYTDANGNTHMFLYSISNQTYATFNIPGVVSIVFFTWYPGNRFLGNYSDANGNNWAFFGTSTGAKPPLISSISPTFGAVGSTVTIKGSSFGSTQGSVSFSGTPVTTYTSWSATAIQCTVPTGATTGPVVVTTIDGDSNGMNFTVTVSP